MQRVRPKEIFARAVPKDILLSYPQPDPGIHTIETCLLVSAAWSVKAKRYFEFGSFKGVTALNLIQNAEPGSHLWTLDLPYRIAHPHAIDTQCMETHFLAGRMAFEGTPYMHQITRLYADSRKWSPSIPSSKLAGSLAGSMDFVFVDGGHDLKTLESDSRNAEILVRPGGVIAWHDYGNSVCPDVTAYLDKYPAPLVAVEDTYLVFWFS